MSDKYIFVKTSADLRQDNVDRLRDEIKRVIPDISDEALTLVLEAADDFASEEFTRQTDNNRGWEGTHPG